MITATLADYAANLRWESLPPDIQARVQEVLLDALACEAAGRRTEILAKLTALAERLGDTGASTRVALAGSAIHSLEFDDAHKRSKTHPASVIVPAVREAARFARASGPDTLAAMVAGYEVTLRLGFAVGTAAHRRAGWHVTCTAGAVGGAAGAARALGLSPEQTAEAIGHAVALLNGNFAFFREAAMEVKPVQVGNAARVAFTAAMLAAEGVRGTRTGLETEDGGFFKLFGGDPQLAIADLNAFRIPEVAFKPYPTCRTVQAGIDAALALHDRYHGGPVHVRTYGVAVEQNGFYADGEVARAAFSLPLLVAAALNDGRIGFDTYAPEHIAALRAKEHLVTWSVDPQLDGRFPEDWPMEVEIEGVPPVRVDIATGDPRNPMTPERWNDKLLACAGDDAERLKREVTAMAEPVAA